MPRGTLLAGCLILGLSACRHPSGTDTSSDNLYGTEDPSGVLPVDSNAPIDPDISDLSAKQAGAVNTAAILSLNANAPVDPNMPDLPVRQAWKQGGKSLTVHRSATCPSESIEESGCGNETSYRFIRSSRQLTLSSCRCGDDRSEEKKLTLSTAQAQDLDRLMASLEMVSGPQVSCTADTSSTLWELIVENAESVEQSFPVALCGTTIRHAGKINVRSFQALYEYLKKTLPE